MGSFKQALAYPFKRFNRIFNILWSLIPIIGGFLVMGYFLRLLESVKEDKNEMPPFGDFGENLKYGFLFSLATVILYSVLFLVFAIVYMLNNIVGIIVLFALVLAIALSYLVLPMIYLEKAKFLDAINLWKALMFVFKNIKDYIILLFKIILINIIWSAPVILMFFLLLSIFKQLTPALIIVYPLWFLISLFILPSTLFLMSACYKKVKENSRSLL